MCSSFNEEIDALALRVERTIARNEAALEEFEEVDTSGPIIPGYTDAGPVDLFS